MFTRLCNDSGVIARAQKTDDSVDPPFDGRLPVERQALRDGQIKRFRTACTRRVTPDIAKCSLDYLPDLRRCQ